MGRLTRFALAGFLGAATAGAATGPALSADLGPPPSMMDGQYRPTPVELGTGWYIRGDIGYVVNNGPEARYLNVPFTGEKLDNTGMFGAGAGYKFTNWFRADLTADYRKSATFTGSTLTPGCCTTKEDARINASTLLLNAYVDLGTWSGITPYVGVGAGLGSVQIDRYTRDSYSAGVNCPCFLPAGQFYLSEYLGRRSTVAPAFALMAGASVDVSNEVKIDAGYRYVHFGSFKTNAAALFVPPVQFKDLSTHEFRIGLRYMIDG